MPYIFENKIGFDYDDENTLTLVLIFISTL